MKQTSGLPELSKTLFIPLAVRANESRCEHPIFIDKMALTILNQCDTANMTIDGGEISTHGILARTQVIDTQVKSLLIKNPCATVINLGAGLDTRFFRLDNGSVVWYDLDLPEVMSLRKQFIPEHERLHGIAKSVLDESWPTAVGCAANDSVIIIAEGLLMYFTQNEVEEIFRILIAAFPNATMLFDVVHSFFVGKKISSDFLWGVKHLHEIERLHPKITLVQAWSAGNLLKQRQSSFFRLLNLFPSTRNRSRIIAFAWKG